MEKNEVEKERKRKGNPGEVGVGSGVTAIHRVDGKRLLLCQVPCYGAVITRGGGSLIVFSKILYNNIKRKVQKFPIYHLHIHT